MPGISLKYNYLQTVFCTVEDRCVEGGAPLNLIEEQKRVVVCGMVEESGRCASEC
jgi:hypothetical protein